MAIELGPILIAGMLLLLVAVYCLRQLPKLLREPGPDAAATQRKANTLRLVGTLADAVGFFLVLTGVGVEQPFAAAVGVALGGLAYAMATLVMGAIRQQAAAKAAAAAEPPRV